jgi:hypothetical protein
MQKIVLLFILSTFTSRIYTSEQNNGTNINKAISQPSKRIKPTYREAATKNNQYHSSKYNHQKTKTPFCDSFDILPPEIQSIIIHFVPHNVKVKTPREACSRVRTLLHINKHSHEIVDNPKFIDGLIETFSSRFHCSHETIARLLYTKQSQNRLTIQLRLKNLCCSEKSEKDDPLLPTLNTLISDKVKLEFTYNHDGYQKTPLMISTGYDNNVFESLLEQGANINGHNSTGTCTLQYAIRNPENESCILQLITHPEIDINHQNSRGETVLLYFLIHVKKPLGPLVVSILTRLLDAGANVKLPDKKGKTPLAVSKKLRKRRITRLIEAQLDPNKLT